MTIVRVINGKEYAVEVLPPTAARGSMTAEEWATKRKPNSHARESRLVREHVLRYGRPAF